MALFSFIFLGLIAAFVMGMGLAWALKSWLTRKHIRGVEEIWAARLEHREHELELTNAKLGAFLNALQTSYGAAQATIRAHEAAQAECQCTLRPGTGSPTIGMVEPHSTLPTWRREAQSWQTKYEAVIQAQLEERDRWQNRLQALESSTAKPQKGTVKVPPGKAQINLLPSPSHRRKRLRSPTKHWMFSILLLEREAGNTKLNPLHFRP